MSASTVPARGGHGTLVPDLAVAVLRRMEAELPDHPDGVRPDRAADPAHLESGLSRCLELARAGTAPGPGDLSAFTAFARDASRRGVPLPTMQRFLRSAVAHALTELWAVARPEDVTELLRLSRWLAQHNGAVERLLVRVYCEQLDPDRADADRHEALAARLLAGLPVTDDVPAARSWLVVVLDGPAPQDTAPPAALRGALGATVDGEHHLLVPITATRSSRAVWESASRWVAAQGLRAAGTSCEQAADLPDAAASVRRMLRVAAAVGLPGGLLGQRDLVLEQVLAAHPRASRDLVGLLDPVIADGRLRETLVAFFAHELDRTATAAALSVSRGGLRLRLDRITELTGLDPRTTRGIQVLRSALSVRALIEAGQV